MIIIYHIIVDSSGSGSGLISILRPLLLPSRYYLCVSLPRQYINYLTTTIYATGISNNPSNIFFTSVTYLALRPLGAGVICAWISPSSSGSISASSSPSLIFCRLFSLASHRQSAPSVTASANIPTSPTTVSFCTCFCVVNSPIPRSAPHVSSNLLPFKRPNSSASRLGKDVNACPRCFRLGATVPWNLSV
jgi:hypothetical protein